MQWLRPGRPIMTEIDRAARFAGGRHVLQTRKGEADRVVPFIVHPLRVAAALEVYYPEDQNLATAAMLHDTIEDTETTRSELQVLFGKDVADLVWAVTNTAGGFAPSKDPRVLRLKAADLFDNISDTYRGIRRGEDVWRRFAAGSGKVLRWRVYVDRVLAVIGDEPMAQRLDAKLRQVEAVMPPPPPSYATAYIAPRPAKDRTVASDTTVESLDAWLANARRQAGLGKKGGPEWTS